MARLAAFIWAVIAGLALAGPAFAHASLVDTDPADGVVLEAMPQTLRLTFNEPVTPTVLRLVAPDGSTADVTAERTGTSLIVTPGLLSEGTHILSWRVVSGDGHPVGGALVFSIGVETGLTVPSSTTDPVVKAALWTARLVLYLGLFIGVGGVFFASWVAGSTGLAAGPQRILRMLMVVGIVAAPVAFALQGVDLLGETIGAAIEPVTWKAALESTYSATLLVAVFVLIAGLVSLGAPQRTRLLSAAALLGIGIAFSLSGHASRAPPQSVTWVIVLTHTVTAAFWAGALLPLASLLRRPDRAALAALRRFSLAIPFAIVPMAGAGLLLAFLQLTTVSDLWETGYGRLLAAKLFAVGLLLVLAILNRVRLTPRLRPGAVEIATRLRRSVILEIILIVAVFAFVSGWRFTPPPRSSEEAIAALAAAVPPFFIHFHGIDMAGNLVITPGAIGLVTATVELQTIELLPLPALELTVTMSNDEAGIGPIRREATFAEGLWTAEGFVLPVGGTWSVEMTALISDFDRRSLTTPVAIIDPRRPTPR